ncbi:MAG: Smr/MutS family protein [Bauldia sp.]|nr:Smr/MutS family protein [Bauldia sp.]MCB1497968.1 Smr/MutS family protein [Bauldia sp.]
MSRRPPRQGLSEEDERLWAAVKNSAKPLRPASRRSAVPKDDAKPDSLPAKAESPPRKPREPRPASRPPASEPRPVQQRPTELDRRTIARLTRGRIRVDARIDLHGLTQSAAHRRLLGFLENAQADGARVALVITGKGRPGEPTAYGMHERGVLRRSVPEWLRSSAFQPIVSGFSEAGRRHGGAGAFYVRIRRLRD